MTSTDVAQSPSNSAADDAKTVTTLTSISKTESNRRFYRLDLRGNPITASNGVPLGTTCYSVDTSTPTSPKRLVLYDAQESLSHNTVKELSLFEDFPDFQLNLESATQLEHLDAS